MSPEDEDRERQGCSACRGTGRLVSNLGGEPHQVACPWCEGSGQFKPGHDAQEHISEPSSPPPPAEPPAPKSDE